MNDSLAYLVQILLLKNDISCDKQELEFQIQSHPSYPSLHAITGVLDHFNIDNLALDVPKTEQTLAQLPKSFLAQLQTKHGNVFTVVINKGLKYQIIFSKKEKTQLSIKDFLEQFTGIIVVAEKTEDTLAPKNSSKSASIVSTIALLLAIVLLININIISSLYILLSAIGIYISVVIMKQELGESTVLGEAFCSNSISKSNCNSVLSSKGAYLGKHKLSDYSFIYFTGLTIASFFLSITNNSLALLLTISFFTLPITIYSIYYQYTIVKEWCLLCLSIVGVLWVQIVLALISLDLIKTSVLSIDNALTIVFSFFSIIALYNIFYPKIKRIKELKEVKVKYFKFIHNFKVFEALLNKSKTVDISIKDTSEIIFGNKNTPLNLTLITNPFCGHCRKVHTLIESILKKHSDYIQIHIRFNINTNNNVLTNITSRLLELYDVSGQDECLKAMHDIYGSLDREAWTLKWGEPNNKTLYKKTLINEHQWCVENDINFTPEILINGKSYPREYERSELLFFIEELYETYNLKMPEKQKITK